MGLARSSAAPLRIRRTASALTSVSACTFLFVLWVATEYVGQGIGLGAGQGQGRQLDSVPLNDLIIDKPYRTSTHRGWVFLHVIGIGYMLLGLNTVCDVYFTGALEVMVERWHIKPDVAGATFMAAGGSAPELFTSFIGTLVVENDVGFGTIVGSAVFNVLFVIGLCGFLSSGDIKLTWWPLFRDCTCYVLGLGLLAIFARDESIVLWEALVLFAAYLLYIVLMYNNAKLEALTDTEFQKARQATAALSTAQSSSAPGPARFTSVQPCADDRGKGPNHKVIGAWEASGEKVIRELPNSESFEHLEGIRTPDAASLGDLVSASCATTDLQKDGDEQVGGRSSARVLTWPARSTMRHASGVRGKMRGSYIQGHVLAERHEMRMASLGTSTNTNNSESGASRPAPTQTFDSPPAEASAQAEDLEESIIEEGEAPGEQGRAPQEAQASAAPQAAGEEEEEGEDDNLMQRPEDRWCFVMWCLSLPVYVPLYYTMPKPSERLFLVTFVFSLLWIAAFNFFLVWWVEILGEVLHIHYIVMSFTLLAAGTSIPDLVSSVAVAKAGEGDMAISSSIGSNIFDILVGLPLPWIIKTGFVDGGSSVAIISKFLTFHLLLLLLMVVLVVICIHCMGWKLTKSLGFLMAMLYVIFLAVAITLEVIEPPPSALQF
mmetsp:Transcript_31/g.108  ORF Transcript_31/g.108 Transcript_31/m.108 type:complete len:661 (+) Transcript_31:138-2120(+)